MGITMLLQSERAEDSSQEILFHLKIQIKAVGIDDLGLPQ